MSVVLQILIILDFEWGELLNLSDRLVIRATHLAGLAHLALNVWEYLQVNTTERKAESEGILDVPGGGSPPH